MLHKEKLNTNLIHLGALSFILLGILAICFYQHRTTMMDAAYQVFVIIFKGQPAIQVNRFGAFVTQLFPYLAVQLGLPLKQVLLSYSLAFIIYPGLLYFILVKGLKSLQFAISIALFYVIMVSHTFYWMQSELLQSCTFLLFFYAFVWKVGYLNYKSLIVFFAGIVILIFFHPLTFIPFFFLYLYTAISLPKKHKAFYLLPLFALLILAYKHFWLPPNEYDQQSIALSTQLFDKWWAFFSFRSTKRFFNWCLSDYYFFPILLGITLAFYKKNKQYFKLVLVISFCLAYLFLVNSTFRWGPAQFHIESFYQVLALFILPPFVIDVLPSWKKKYQYYFLLALFSIRLLHIGLQSQPYSKRLAWNKQALEKVSAWNGKKFMTLEKEVPMDKLFMTWASPYETLLLSALIHPDSAKSIMIANPDLVPVSNLLKEKRAFLTPYGPIPLKHLPKRYFNLNDSTHYQELKRKDLPF